MVAFTNAAGQEEMEYDEEYAPTAAEIAQEKKEEPLMIKNAERWDHFLDHVRGMQAPWPQGDPDTDDYRKVRAVETFSLGWAVASLSRPSRAEADGHHMGPHILLFIVPRQMLELGDPARRSCDSCESFGAMLKKIIKHSTCRRRLRTGKLRTSTESRPLQLQRSVGGSRPSKLATSNKHTPELVCARRCATARRTRHSYSGWMRRRSGPTRASRPRTRSLWMPTLSECSQWFILQRSFRLWMWRRLRRLRRRHRGQGGV